MKKHYLYNYMCMFYRTGDIFMFRHGSGKQGNL